MSRDHIQFVTGRLAEHSLRQIVEPLARQVEFEYTIDVMPITVAALMTPEWIARRIRLSPGATRVLVPGYCTGDLSPIEAVAGVPGDRSLAGFVSEDAVWAVARALGHGPLSWQMKAIAATPAHAQRKVGQRLRGAATLTRRAGARAVSRQREPASASTYLDGDRLRRRLLGLGQTDVQ